MGLVLFLKKIFLVVVEVFLLLDLVAFLVVVFLPLLQLFYFLVHQVNLPSYLQDLHLLKVYFHLHLHLLLKVYLLLEVQRYLLSQLF